LKITMLCFLAPSFQIPDPLGFPRPKYTFIRTTSRIWLTRSSTASTLPNFLVKKCLYKQFLLVFEPLALPSLNSVNLSLPRQMYVTPENSGHSC
jgi:hypothetical protein